MCACSTVNNSSKVLNPAVRASYMYVHIETVRIIYINTSLFIAANYPNTKIKRKIKQHSLPVIIFISRYERFFRKAFDCERCNFYYFFFVQQHSN